MKEKKRTVSIRTRLIALIIPIVLVIIVSFFALSTNMIVQLSKEKMTQEAKVYAEDISGWTTQILSELQVYKDTIEGGGFENDDEILRYMEHSVEKNDAYPVGLYMGDDSGVYLDGSGWVPDDDWVLTERDWYLEGKNNSKFAFGEPYYDSKSKDVCVSATVRMNYEKAVRVLAVDVYLDYVSEVVSGIASQEGARAFLVTGNTQTIVAHTQQDLVAMTLDEEGMDCLYGNVSKALADNRTGLVELQGDDGAYFTCIHPIANTDWYLVSYMTEREVLAELTRLEIVMAGIAVVAAFALIIGTLQIMNHVVKPVAKMTNVITGIAQGDFSQNLEVKGNDEIAKMSHNMQVFITGMRETIGDISTMADWLKNQSKENACVSDSLIDASKSQSEAMEILEGMVEQLSGDVALVSEHMESLMNVIATTKTEGILANELMQECVEATDDGKQNMEKIGEGMDGISESITSLSDRISQVGEATSQIGDMVNIIVDIASETNLLSLNASIEAARAGEAGRGFAVVAEQIGQLATNSAKAAEDISRLTDRIQSSVDLTLTRTKESVAEVKHNTETVAAAGEAFTSVFEKVNDTSQRVAQMMEMISQVDRLAVEMETITGNQVKAAEKIAESSRALEQYTHNVTENSDTVAESASELKKESESLMGKMSRFRI